MLTRLSLIKIAQRRKSNSCCKICSASIAPRPFAQGCRIQSRMALRPSSRLSRPDVAHARPGRPIARSLRIRSNSHPQYQPSTHADPQGNIRRPPTAIDEPSAQYSGNRDHAARLTRPDSQSWSRSQSCHRTQWCRISRCTHRLQPLGRIGSLYPPKPYMYIAANVGLAPNAIHPITELPRPSQDIPLHRLLPSLHGPCALRATTLGL